MPEEPFCVCKDKVIMTQLRGDDQCLIYWCNRCGSVCEQHICGANTLEKVIWWHPRESRNHRSEQSRSIGGKS